MLTTWSIKRFTLLSPSYLGQIASHYHFKKASVISWLTEWMIVSTTLRYLVPKLKLSFSDVEFKYNALNVSDSKEVLLV